MIGGRYAAEIAAARQAALLAAEVIRRHYAAGAIAVDTKADDSPVTQADRDANAVIVQRLTAAFPDDGILSEESPDDATRLGKRRVWIIDPLDGTRDFVARTGEFSVHVALAVDGEAVVGVVAQPVIQALFIAATGAGAVVERDGQIEPLGVSSRAQLGELRIGVSRLNLSSRVGACLRAAGLDGALNLSSGECEWDTCAPEVIVHEAGGRVTDGLGAPFRYNKPSPAHHHGSVVSNGVSHDQLVALVAPYAETLG